MRRKCRYPAAISRALSAAAAAAVIVLLAFHSAEAALPDEPAFTVSTLSVADKILDLIAEDLDGDSLRDILVIHRKGLEPDETRWVSVFLQKSGGGFSTAADQSWEVDSSAVILDIGEVTGDGSKEICFLTPEGVWFHGIEAGEYVVVAEKLFETRSLAVFPSRRTIPLIDFIRDWNDDGSEEVGIYGFEGLVLYGGAPEGGYTLSNRLEVELRTGMSGSRLEDGRERTSGLGASFGFPSSQVIDFNGDGNKDLVATRDDRVIVYFRDAGGMFSEKPSEDIHFDVRTQREKIESTAFTETVIEDLNNDGFADAIVTKQTAKGLSSFRGVINIYYGSPEGYPGTPDQVIISEGSASERTIMSDVNGDGRMDMILPSIKISVASIIRFLLTRSVPINFNIFLLHEDNRYSERPDFSKEVKFKIDFSGETDAQAVSLSGDFNGDKRKDFVFGTGEEELSIYLGEAGASDQLFSKKPAVKLEVPAFGELFSLDLNSDGYSDMIIYYPQSKERKGTIKVLFNMRKV